MTETDLKKLLKFKTRQALLGELMGGICHEMNNPLTILLGNLGILEKFAKKEPQMPSEKILYFTHEIGSSSVRIQKIVATLRAISKGEHNETIDKENIDELIEQVQVLLKTRLSREKIELKLAGYPCQVSFKCSAGLFVETFLHILINSIEAIQNTTEKWIQIEYSEAQGSNDFYVSDSAQIPFGVECFKEFHTTKTAHAGLGLTFAEELMHLNGGRIEIGQFKGQHVIKLSFAHQESLS